MKSQMPTITMARIVQELTWELDWEATVILMPFLIKAAPGADQHRGQQHDNA